ncbi:hypothetical protein Taro_031482 [Colocasia esculenta]|uniref:Secreted protein n=1 Tax=Colocasia esculenta TaxID=4460 RepID=A0A843VQ49_COLES|nr:hypothetical protein [Colocasia esculenta]
MGLQLCGLQVVVLVGLHCSCLYCGCGAAVGPFVLDCETESPITLAFEVSVLVPSDSRYLYPLGVGFVLWYVVYQPFKCCDELIFLWRS